MIDWIKMIVPMPHDEPISAGQVMSVNAEGELEWKTIKRRGVKGSWEAGLQVRTATNEIGKTSHLEIDGNPVKFFQGHNLWGTDDLPALVIATCEAVADALGLPVSPETRQLWKQGIIRLSRLDLTESFHLENRAQVLAWLRAAEQTAHLSHRGRGQLVKGTTLYFGKHSRRWSLKLYAKGQEISAKGHKQQAIQDLPSALEWADRTLRAEIVLRAMELKRRNLDWLIAWLPVDGVPFGVTPELLRECLGDMTMTTTAHLSAEVLATLKPAQRAAYAAWEAGNDLREMFPRNTFYRHRAALLPHGIDIATLVPKDVSNVVPLYRVLEAKPAQIPAWAHGTPLYFEPRRVA